MTKSIQLCLFFALCVAIPFENTALAAIGGVFTAPLSIVLIPALLVFVFLNRNALAAGDIWLIKVFLLLLMSSVVMLAFWLPDYDIDFLLDRGVRFILLALPTIVVYLFCVALRLDLLEKGIVVVFSVVAAIYLLNLLVPSAVNNVSPLQHTPALAPHRMRGFTLEASTFGFQFTVAFLLFSSVKKISPFVAFALLFLLCAPITSKGTMVCIGVAGFVAFSHCYVRVTPAVKIAVTSFMLVALVSIVSGPLAEMFHSSIYKYGSVGTRSAVILLPLVSLVHFPLGVGFFGFLPAFYEYGPLSVDFLDMLFPNVMNFDEVFYYFIPGNTIGVSTKSFFMDWFLYGGLIFLIAYYKAARFLFLGVGRMYSFPCLTLLVFVVLATTFFVPVDGRLIAPLAVAYLVRMIRENSRQAI
ncbi:hypothetical protein [Agaribacterium haliotis]|uniref:hypothetical protein n=1 Tax=Agaribacterium haliotis TaxID=2013869 RepID=UPI000BB55B21|nr:hypothetical protein [Agaribacterium haliotis]